ncbi:J domain-containing protein [Parvularcula lutaonensis]|uniref:J domain-containing protein n=1 Tax=Parvularcula lutaonensis TaxID=491923 RepID=A0ABV7M982_9PROT|nr:hypothetical protein [Parvularcula lutaonensis]GGY44683.1 hypothetical protein GCM10007148_11990 [Parvularcula lutaonensis]
MLLFALAVLLLVSGFVARKLDLSVALKRRLALIGAATAAAVILLAWMRLTPLAAMALAIGAGFAGTQVMREVGRKGDFEELGDKPPPTRPRPPGMDRAEALAVLGLDGDPDEAAIQAAHKRMIVRAHPDQGGSDYLAAKVNEARKVLLHSD